jgi:hypothetical protein
MEIATGIEAHFQKWHRSSMCSRYFGNWKHDTCAVNMQ